MKIRDMMNPNILLVNEENSLADTLAEMKKENASYILSMKNHNLCKLFTPGILLEACLENGGNQSLKELPSVTPFMTLDSWTSLDFLADIPTGTYIAITEDGNPIGILFYTRTIRELYFFSVNQKLNMPFHGFQQVFENIEEEIVVAKGDGRICYVNPKAEQLIGLPMSELLSKTLQDIEDEKIFYPSAALRVLRTRKKVDLQTQLSNGEKRISTAIPIFNEAGEIEYTVCTSKNVDEILNLNRKIQSREKKLAQKDQEILRMQKRDFEQMNFYFNSPAMFKVMNSIKRVAPLDMTVLIQGETGVGKEIVAKSIHYLSARNLQPFVKINCGLIAENLIESELFGYEEGAFTGASKGGKKGKIEAANGGTLFLDEIGEMPLSLQVKLLDFLQDSSYVRVGGTRRRTADVRIISATNRKLQEMAQDGAFRTDLFYRLNVFNIHIPPLRDRLEDIPELTEYFLKKFSSKYKLERRLSSEGLHEMYEHSWPGNVRELEHTLERAMVMSESEEISGEILREILHNRQEGAISILCNGIPSYKKAKSALEKVLIEKAYTAFGSTYKAAEALGIDQSTAARLWKKYRSEL